jgi:predicted metalloprotease
VRGGSGTPADALAATVVAGVEGYWRQVFPAQFGRRWENVHGYYAVDPEQASRSANTAQPGPVEVPPCVRHPADLRDQALYCARLDVVVWDRVALIPRLVETNGASAVTVALAHEMGHAVQNRIGIDATLQTTDRERHPTILLEGMADCFAGSTLRAVIDGRVPELKLSRPDLDRALRALLSFRDPPSGPGGAVPGGAVPGGAHGDAFDRASAFTHGYTSGPGSCAAMTMQNQVFTQRGYTSFADEASGGDLNVRDLVRFVGADASAWFGQLVSNHGRRWHAPTVTLNRDVGCATPAVDRQGPVRFCPDRNTLIVSEEQLGTVHDARGDYASGALLASRYALAAMAALGRPVAGTAAGPVALCLTGAYTRAVFDRMSGFRLSPGDIDEAVDELLDEDTAARDVSGTAPAVDLGFDRVRQFQAGVRNGPDRCGL